VLAGVEVLLAAIFIFIDFLSYFPLAVVSLSEQELNLFNFAHVHHAHD
jgi:hypothetical protein